MKNINISSVLLASIALFGTVSCGGGASPNNSSPTIPSDANSLIFGHFYGQCQGEKCIETFKMADGKLYEDTKDDYSHKSFTFEQLDTSKYNDTKGLMSQVPAELLTQAEGNIGCPDCADQGGVYLEYTQGTETKKWRVDNNLANVPAEIHPFINSIKNSINTINEENTPVDTVSGIQELTFYESSGWCGVHNDCAPTFKLTENEVFLGSMTGYQTLSQQKFDNIHGFLNEVPKALLAEESQILCTNCADQSTYYVSFEHEGKLKSWTIDADLNYVPSELHDFVGVLKEHIKNLKKPIDTSDQNNTTAVDYLVFGKFSGHCQGDKCIETFKLTKDALFADTLDDKSLTSFNFLNTIETSKFNLAKDLINQVPDSILSQNNETIGCPDCADQGGYYVEYSINGTVKKHKIDTQTSQVPANLHPFVTSIADTLDVLTTETKDMVMCPAVYEPVCVKEVVNNEEVFNTYSNDCSAAANGKGLALSTTQGACE